MSDRITRTTNQIDTILPPANTSIQSHETGNLKLFLCCTFSVCCRLPWQPLFKWVEISRLLYHAFCLSANAAIVSRFV